MSGPYRDTHASVLKLCNDFATTNGLSVLDFDSHAAGAAYPNSNIVGPYQFEFSEDEGLFTVHTMIGVSTIDDPNLFTLRALVDSLYDYLRPNRTMKLYNADTSTSYGVMKVKNGTSVSPLATSDNRPVIFIACSLVTDQKMLVP